ncbi:hypothetical protein BDD12DRAFT_303162 [Trichophaea hybrida]|nr:hypothetical protein BDD12DRAFT_303162 [Trichophaea hybrida]
MSSELAQPHGRNRECFSLDPYKFYGSRDYTAVCQAGTSEHSFLITADGTCCTSTYVFFHPKFMILFIIHLLSRNRYIGSAHGHVKVMFSTSIDRRSFGHIMQTKADIYLPSPLFFRDFRKTVRWAERNEASRILIGSICQTGPQFSFSRKSSNQSQRAIQSKVSYNMEELVTFLVAIQQNWNRANRSKEFGFHATCIYYFLDYTGIIMTCTRCLNPGTRRGKIFSNGWYTFRLGCRLQGIYM